jgi:SAM-dependent methyltransferase
MVEWEEPDCLLCGSHHWVSIIEAPDTATGGSGLWFAVVQCQDCGLCFTNPRPSLKSMRQFYPSPTALTPLRNFSPPGSFWSFFRKKTRRKRHWDLPWHGEGRLLDIGCRNSSFLQYQHGRGWQVLGLAPSGVVVERLRQIKGFQALVGGLPQARLKSASFDAVTMWHSLEHVHWPLQVLREVFRLLVPGGHLLIAVPNIDSLSFRWFGSAWYGLDLPRHLLHFSPWTLHLMLEQVGFRVSPIRLIPHRRWCQISSRLSYHQGGSPRWHRLLAFKPLSHLATWYGHLTGQSDAIVVRGQRPRKEEG